MTEKGDILLPKIKLSRKESDGNPTESSKLNISDSKRESEILFPTEDSQQLRKGKEVI